MYLDLARFVLPLGLTETVRDVGEMAANAAIARLSSSSADTIGVFTAVVFFMMLLGSFTKSFKPVVLALPQTRTEFARILQAFLLVCLALFLLTVLIAVTPLACLVTGLDADQGPLLRRGFLTMSLMPTVVGARYVLEGVLSRKRIAAAQAIASISGLAVQVASTVLVLTVDVSGMLGLSDLAMSAATVYAGALTQVIILALGWWRFDGVIFPATAAAVAADSALSALSVRSTESGSAAAVATPGAAEDETRLLQAKEDDEDDDDDGGEEDGRVNGAVEAGGKGSELRVVRVGGVPRGDVQAGPPQGGRGAAAAAAAAVVNNVSLARVFAFSGPLILTELVQRVSRPVINAICASTGGSEAVAVLGLVYPIGHLSYGWINALKSTEAAFHGSKYGPEETRAKIHFFAAVCVATGVAVGLLGVLSGFFDWVLQDVQGVDSELAAKCRLPLLLFAVFAVPVGVRGVITGHLVAEKNTQPLLYSGPVRLVCIGAMLLLLPVLGVAGGMLGVGALLAGFISETSTTLVGIRCQNRSRAAAAAAASAAVAAASEAVASEAVGAGAHTAGARG